MKQHICNCSSRCSIHIMSLCQYHHCIHLFLFGLSSKEGDGYIDFDCMTSRSKDPQYHHFLNRFIWCKDSKWHYYSLSGGGEDKDLNNIVRIHMISWVTTVSLEPELDEPDLFWPLNVSEEFLWWEMTGHLGRLCTEQSVIIRLINSSPTAGIIKLPPSSCSKTKNPIMHLAVAVKLFQRLMGCVVL